MIHTHLHQITGSIHVLQHYIMVIYINSLVRTYLLPINMYPLPYEKEKILISTPCSTNFWRCIFQQYTMAIEGVLTLYFPLHIIYFQIFSLKMGNRKFAYVQYLNHDQLFASHIVSKGWNILSSKDQIYCNTCKKGTALCIYILFYYANS